MSTNKQKKYKIEFSFAVTEGQEDVYSPPRPVNVCIKENVPTGQDPMKVLAARMSEELKRNKDVDLDWQDVEKDSDNLDVGF